MMKIRQHAGKVPETSTHSPENERLEPENHPFEKEVIFSKSSFSLGSKC